MRYFVELQLPWSLDQMVLSHKEVVEGKLTGWILSKCMNLNMIVSLQKLVFKWCAPKSWKPWYWVKLLNELHTILVSHTILNKRLIMYRRNLYVVSLDMDEIFCSLLWNIGSWKRGKASQCLLVLAMAHLKVSYVKPWLDLVWINWCSRRVARSLDVKNELGLSRMCEHLSCWSLWSFRVWLSSY